MKLTKRSSKSPHQRVTVGYIRISTLDQDLEKNRADILAFANRKRLGNVDWVEETVSGTKDWRQREIGNVVNRLGEGDVIITPEFSRLARSTIQILEIVKKCTEKGIEVHVVKGDWSNDGELSSEVLLLAFSMVAQIERSLISLRTKEGLRAAREKGRQIGRPRGPGKSKLDPYRPEIEALLKNGSKQSYIARRYGTSPGNLINWLQKNQIDTTPHYPSAVST